MQRKKVDPYHASSLCAILFGSSVACAADSAAPAAVGSAAPAAAAPAAADSAAARPAAAPPAAAPRFSLAVGGASVPGTSVYGGQATYILASPGWSGDVRIGVLGWASEDEYTKGKGGVVLLEQNHWWTTYGLGYGSALGMASFEKKTSSGWEGSSPQILAYFTPVQLRSGRSPAAFEVSLDIGVTRFFSPPTNREDSGVRPFGMISLGVAL